MRGIGRCQGPVLVINCLEWDWGDGGGRAGRNVAAESRAAAVLPVQAAGRYSRYGLLTDNAVAVTVSHILIGGMAAGHRCDAVPAGFGAGDAAVAVVVVAAKWIAIAIAARARRRRRRCGWRRRGRRAWFGKLHGGAAAAGQHPFCGCGLGPVHREIVFAFDHHDLVHVPARVQGGQPLGYVLVDLLVSVHTGAGQGEVKQVASECAPGVVVGGAEAAVVGFAAGDDVFDVSFAAVGEVAAGVRAVYAAALLGDDLGLDALGVRVVVGVVVRAAVFGHDSDAAQVAAAAPTRG